MVKYAEIHEDIKPCPYCGSKDIRYSVAIANNKQVPRYHAQCYCNNCKANGPRVIFTPDLKDEKGFSRSLAEKDSYAKAEAIKMWDNRY